jgi:hypothetical protein
MKILLKKTPPHNEDKIIIDATSIKVQLDNNTQKRKKNPQHRRFLTSSVSTGQPCCSNNLKIV